MLDKIKSKLGLAACLFKRNGFLFTLMYFGERLLLRFHRQVVYEADLSAQLFSSEWKEGEELLNFGRENGSLINEEVRKFTGGEVGQEYLNGIAKGDRLFMVKNKDGYLYYGYILFKTRETKILGEERDVPLIANCFTAPAARGQGIYRRALNDKLCYLQKAGYKRVIIATHLDNRSSRRGIEAASFKLCRVVTAYIFFNIIAIEFIKDASGNTCRIVLV